MAFREKSAWIMALSLLLGGVVYAYVVAQTTAAAGALAPPLVPALVVYTVLLAVLAVAGHVLAAVSAPGDAAAPEDERDRQIVRRAGHASSTVLTLGVVLALGGYLFTRDGDLLFYSVFASLMLGSLVTYLLQIYLYRRGG